MEDFTEYCRDVILEELDNYEGQTVYGCDLGYTLTEAMNCDGTCTYSTWKAKEYLKEWWDEAADYFEYEKFTFGKNLHNPFENPEEYMVCMVIEGVAFILSRCATIDRLWNEEFELTPELIKTIKAEAKGVEEVEF